jgi:hypothetical protein
MRKPEQKQIDAEFAAQVAKKHGCRLTRAEFISLAENEGRSFSRDVGFNTLRDAEKAGLLVRETHDRGCWRLPDVPGLSEAEAEAAKKLRSSSGKLEEIRPKTVKIQKASKASKPALIIAPVQTETKANGKKGLTRNEELAFQMLGEAKSEADKEMAMSYLRRLSAAS